MNSILTRPEIVTQHDSGQTKTLSDEFIDGSQVLSLFENDGDHWYDRDDFIGKHTITESPINTTLDLEATSARAFLGITH